MSRARCSSCGREIAWCVTEGGSYMPLDPEAVDVTNVEPGDVAVRTRGRVLGADDAHDWPRLERWMMSGVRYFRNHWRTCPSSERHRVAREQQQLDV